uniref:Plastid lipid-associated protein/fibrillin conserved domain-containing protein n=1 Tax=Tetradesmus obliquus TaxID=3088 RepID=A0A383VLT1_TETOB|eukprot:jgi/Sobl393_1/15420/SZX65840.1
MSALQLSQNNGMIARSSSRRIVTPRVVKAGGRVMPMRRLRAAAEEASIAQDFSSAPVMDFAMAMAEPESDEMSAADIKAALLDSFYGTERGLSARSEVRAEINELITQLEAKNPTPSPTEMMALLDGDWKLVYTSNSELLAILALSKLPFVTIGDITQRVDTITATVENRAALSVPLSRTSLSATASFEVRSPKRLQIAFERGSIATPELLSDLEVPESVDVLGQTVDLSQLRGVLQPFSQGLSSILKQVGGIVSQAPDLSFPISNDSASTWLLTTYLDEDTRITRGDGGSVFILTKDTSSSSSHMTPEQEAVAEAMML